MENKEKIEKDVFVSFMKKNASSINGNCLLCGGAIIDILDGNTPKDYDILGYNKSAESVLLKNGFKFLYESTTARTFVGLVGEKKIVVQFLKQPNTDNFDFTISTSTYNLKNGLLKLDECYESRLLVPVNWGEKRILASGLMRIPHWERKGFKAHHITYKSMLRKVLGMSYSGNSDDRHIPKGSIRLDDLLR